MKPPLKKQLRIETTTFKKIKIVIWEEIRGDYTAIITQGKKRYFMEFGTLSGARSWAYFNALYMSGATRI